MAANHWIRQGNLCVLCAPPLSPSAAGLKSHPWIFHLIFSSSVLDLCSSMKQWIKLLCVFGFWIVFSRAKKGSENTKAQSFSAMQMFQCNHSPCLCFLSSHYRSFRCCPGAMELPGKLIFGGRNQKKKIAQAERQRDIWYLPFPKHTAHQAPLLSQESRGCYKGILHWALR